MLCSFYRNSLAFLPGVLLLVSRHLVTANRGKAGQQGGVFGPPGGAAFAFMEASRLPQIGVRPENRVVFVGPFRVYAGRVMSAGI